MTSLPGGWTSRGRAGKTRGDVGVVGDVAVGVAGVADGDVRGVLGVADVMT